MASILTNSVGSSQVEGGPDLAEGHSTILTKMRMYREVNWASSEGGGSLGSVGKGKVGTAKAALCVKVDPRNVPSPLQNFGLPRAHVKFQTHSSPLPLKTK